MKLALTNVIDAIRCPRCLGRLIVPGAKLPLSPAAPTGRDGVPYVTENCTVLCVECGGTYSFHNGVPHLLGEEVENPEDEEWQATYDERADQYDANIRRQIERLGINYQAEQDRLMRRLELCPGMRVLEVSVGTGRNLADLANGLGNGGEIWALDLSTGMLRLAAPRAENLAIPVALVRANAAALPFASGAFDAVLHVGGLNTFGLEGRALVEMVRVAKPGAKIVVVDEGMPEGERGDSWYQQVMEANSLFREHPPVHLVPFPELAAFELDWMLRRLFYVMDMRKDG